MFLKGSFLLLFNMILNLDFKARTSIGSTNGIWHVSIILWNFVIFHVLVMILTLGSVRVIKQLLVVPNYVERWLLSLEIVYMWSNLLWIHVFLVFFFPQYSHLTTQHLNISVQSHECEKLKLKIKIWCLGFLDSSYKCRYCILTVGCSKLPTNRVLNYFS